MLQLLLLILVSYKIVKGLEPKDTIGLEVALLKRFFDTIQQHGYDIKTIVCRQIKPAEAGTIGAGLDAVNNAITSGLNFLGFESPPKNPTPMVQMVPLSKEKPWALRGAWIKSVNFGTHDYSVTN